MLFACVCACMCVCGAWAQPVIARSNVCAGSALGAGAALDAPHGLVGGLVRLGLLPWRKLLDDLLERRR